MSLHNHHHHHHANSAIYQPILDVPVFPYSRRHDPKAISPQYECFSLPESLDRVCKYDYRLEEAVIKAADEGKRDAELQEAATAERRKRVEAKRREAAAAIREAEAEKVKSMAPGFSADAVLQPTAAQSPKFDPDANEAGKIVGDQRAHKLHNYLEFEQGLAPPDPWDTPHTFDDDLKALGGVMQNQEGGKPPSRPTSPVKPNNSVMGFHVGPSPLHPPSSYAYQPPDYVSQMPYHLPPTEYVSSGVSNMNIRSSPGGYIQPGADGGAENVHGPTTKYPLSAPNQYTSQPGPPRPPKNFDNYEPRPPTYQTTQHHRMYNPVNPPNSMQSGPGSEENPVNNLMNMGFSQQQAMEALQRHNYNMEGALNFLLDHS